MAKDLPEVTAIFCSLVLTTGGVFSVLVSIVVRSTSNSSTSYLLFSVAEVVAADNDVVDAVVAVDEG